jgi:hypothetical protein
MRGLEKQNSAFCAELLTLSNLPRPGKFFLGTFPVQPLSKRPVVCGGRVLVGLTWTVKQERRGTVIFRVFP